MKKILIVDDEVQILKALQRMFLETDYEVHMAESSAEAMKLLETTDIDLVISDMRMPFEDGYKLLSMVKDKYPKIIRIILSGYADEKPMFRALLHNIAKLYVFKPWNNTDFLNNIKRLFADESVIHSEELLDKINKLGLSSEIPTNCEAMIGLIEEENTEKLIENIENDPEISNLLIQVAKSAVYGVMPNTVRQASLYIGLHNLKAFMRWACIVCAATKNAPKADKPEILVSHSYLTNRIYLFLFEAFLHKQPPESAMFSGLMHNIGLILLVNCLQTSGKLSAPLDSADDYMQVDYGEYMEFHQEVGAHFLDQWDLPFTLYEAALYHHNPLHTNVINQEMVACVHIAQAYAWKTLGVSEPKVIAPEVFKCIDTTVEEFEMKLSRYLKGNKMFTSYVFMNC